MDATEGGADAIVEDFTLEGLEEIGTAIEVAEEITAGAAEEAADEAAAEAAMVEVGGAMEIPCGAANAKRKQAKRIRRNMAAWTRGAGS